MRRGPQEDVGDVNYITPSPPPNTTTPNIYSVSNLQYLFLCRNQTERKVLLQVESALSVCTKVSEPSTKEDCKAKSKLDEDVVELGDLPEDEHDYDVTGKPFRAVCDFKRRYASLPRCSCCCYLCRRCCCCCVAFRRLWSTSAIAIGFVGGERWCHGADFYCFYLLASGGGGYVGSVVAFVRTLRSRLHFPGWTRFDVDHVGC